MIYILDKPYNQGLYEQWIDVVDRTNIPYEVIVFNREEADLKFTNYLGNKKTLDFLKNKIQIDDLLLIDSSFFQQRSAIEQFSAQFPTVSWSENPVSNC